ncbi:DnaA ATPase domain-containing protein [Parvularcula dongshanensis]|uniref:Chromosomal replication initiator protein DnaA n=1 Tax=Parvularcula dongshanensis TaxID=1173995 RepID=A0A840HZC4_9PROT|nr:DnaA/Hda family protein [Parvularcula dongshanensis]MBB4657777.1 chromosomal replication initiator protein [Parvularcula dongshanensis]
MPTPSDLERFDTFKSELRDRFGAAVYSSYFETLGLAEASSSNVVLHAPTRFSASLISQRFAPGLREVWSEACGPVNRLSVKGVQDLAQVRRIEVEAERPAALAPARAASRLKASPFRKGLRAEESAEMSTSAGRPERDRAEGLPFDSELPSQFHSAMTLERFCVNDTNRLARHAVTKMLDGTGAALTYLHGASGRGKTHLLNAAAQEWLRRRPTDNVLYLTYDSLMTDVSEAFISKSVKELRSFLQSTDVLLVDDIQLLRGRKRTQEELDCLIDRLRGAGKRVLVAGALPPARLSETGISQRLADRLAGGLCVSIDKPDYDLRLRVARQAAALFEMQTGLPVPQRHIDLIARRCEDSVRELEGMLSLLQVAIEAEGGREGPAALSDERVRKLLAEHLSHRRQAVTVEDVFDFTVRTFGLTKEEVAGRARKQPIVRARHAFCLAARKLTDTPLTAIGAMINRDHTTVMHSVKAAEILAETDAVFGDRITAIFDEFERG